MTPWVLTLLAIFRPPGDTHFSVTPAADCGRNAELPCEGGSWSPFYGGWVRKETEAEGRARYSTLAEGQEKAIEAIMCVKLDGTKIDGCLPEPVALDKKSKRLLFGAVTALAALNGASLAESGYREDVQVGRGFARACPKGGPVSIEGVCGPSADGGQGRGPGGEACVMQIHPTIGWRFADAPLELRERAAAGNAAAQEEIMRSLVGRDVDSIERCYRAGLRMLLHATAYCDWQARVSKSLVPAERWFAMYSLYGTGTTCLSVNQGKTRYRTELFYKILARAKVLAKAEARDS